MVTKVNYGPKTKKSTVVYAFMVQKQKKHSCICILDTTVLDDSMELEQKNCYCGD